MKKLLIISMLLLILMGGCEEQNRKNLNLLEVGMTKAQVIEIMGSPYRREAESNREWLLYQTEGKDFSLGQGRIPKPDSEWLTPLLIQDGKLIGWGSSYWTNKEQKFDIKINQKVEQE